MGEMLPGQGITGAEVAGNQRGVGDALKRE